jgi:hypothetical protein
VLQSDAIGRYTESIGGSPEEEAAMESGSLPVVRIADDAELTDVRQLLEQLGVEWVAEDEALDRPTALWIGTPARLIAPRASSAPRPSGSSWRAR